MKQLNELHVPDDRKYSDDHEWAKPVNGQVRIGISDYAQSELGDAVYVELPEVGRMLQKDSEFGTLESVKAVSELRMPVGGEVTAVNEALASAPEEVNSDPFGKAWMVKLELSDIVGVYFWYNYLTSKEGPVKLVADDADSYDADARVAFYNTDAGDCHDWLHRLFNLYGCKIPTAG